MKQYGKGVVEELAGDFETLNKLSLTEEDYCGLIEEELKRQGIDTRPVDAPPSAPPPPPTGFNFMIPVTSPTEKDPAVMHIIHGVWSRRENKRILRKYLTQMGYKSKDEQKRILKAMGFWTKSQLGTKP